MTSQSNTVINIETLQKLQGAAYMVPTLDTLNKLLEYRKLIAIQLLTNKTTEESKTYLTDIIDRYNDEIKKLLYL